MVLDVPLLNVSCNTLSLGILLGEAAEIDVNKRIRREK